MQVPGGKTRRHRRPVTTDDCSSLHGCCSDGQTRPRLSDGGSRRCCKRRKRENCSIIDSHSCCSGSSTSPCSCPVTSKESSLDVDCYDYDDDDAMTCCCCYLPCGPLLQPTPWLCCLNNRDVYSQRLACPGCCCVRFECYPSPGLPMPACRPLLTGQCCPGLPQLCYLDEGGSRQLACACHGCSVGGPRCQSPTVSSPPSCCPVVARPGPVVCSGGTSGSGSVQSACPFLCQCGPGGQSVDMRLELQTTPRGCCVGPRPNTLQPSSHLHSTGLRSNSGLPVCDRFCPAACLHSTNTEESQPRPTVCTGACCTTQASSLSHPTRSRPTEESNSRSSVVCPAGAVQESGPPPSTSAKSLGTPQSATSPPHFRVKSAEQSKWRTSTAEKRRVSGRTAATAASAGRTGTTAAEQTDDGTEFSQDISAKPVTTAATTTTTNATATTTAASGGGGGGKPDEVARRTDQRGIPPSSGVTDITSSTLPSTTLCRDLPLIASGLTHVCAQLASRVTESTPRSSSVVPNGEELRQLVEAIAAIEHDVRAMSAALQSNTENTTGQLADNCDTSVANSPSFTVLADSDGPEPTENTVVAPGTGRTTAAVALLLPPVEMSVLPTGDRRTLNAETSNIEASSDGTRAGTSNKPPKIGGGTQKLTKDTKLNTAWNRGRVMVLPPSANNEDKVGGTNRQSDYVKYASTPTATSRLPFRLAATQAAAVAHTEERNRKRSGLEETATTAATGRGRSATAREAIRVSAADRPEDSDTDSVSSDKPRFTDIHQIIRHLESMGVASPADSTKHSRPADSGIAQYRPTDGSIAQSRPADSGTVQSKPAESGFPHSEKKTNTAPVMDVAPPRSLRSAGTSPIDFVGIYSKQTQTSPKSSAQTPPQSAVRLHQDDRNMTIKSRSLESQQQQQQQQQLSDAGATSTAVMPLALPRSSGAVTAAAIHTVAIPLPPPPTTTTPAGGAVDTTTNPGGREQESASVEQEPDKSEETGERKRQQGQP